MASQVDEDSGPDSGNSGQNSSVLHLQELGRPAVVFPPSEVKFDGGNMFEWSKMVTLTVYGCLLGDHLTDLPKAVADPEFKKWKAEESLILSWMLRSMTPEMRRDFLYCNTVKELWDEIQRYTAEQSHDWRIYELRVLESQARQGTENIRQYSSRLKAIWRETDHLWPTQNPLSVERQYILKQRIFTFLMGLNQVFEAVRSQLLHREKLPTLEEAISATLQAESRFGVTPDSQGQNSSALLTKKPEGRGGPPGGWTTRPAPPNPAVGGDGEDNRDSLFCNYCKKRRHTKENCWKLAWKNQQSSSGKKALVAASEPSSSTAAVTNVQVEEIQERLSSTALAKSGLREDDFVL
ncbi:uncharacterized protein LOC144706347 [Wolffia australiana]